MTYLQLVNNILRRLREDTVTSVDDTDYSTLIGILVNQSKELVEDAWEWNSLREIISVTTLTDETTTYELSGTTDRTVVYPVGYNVTMDHVIHAQNREYLNYRNQLDDGFVGTDVLYFRDGGMHASNETRQVEVFPRPTSAQSLKFSVYNPQAELSSDSTIMTVPSRPVLLRAWALAISERGEDGGSLWNEVDQWAKDSLADAILTDQSLNQSELVWGI